jgi:hypothetical protein
VIDHFVDRGSRAISTIGEYVQEMPFAVASRAAILALFSTSVISHIQLIANGIGKMVLYP